MVWTSLLPQAWILGLAVLAVVLAHEVYRHEKPARNRHLRTPAWILRAAVLLAVLTAFLGPSLPQEEVQLIRPRLGILVDASRSMGLTDAAGKRSRLDRARAFLERSLPGLAARYEVDLFGFGSDLRPLQDLAGLLPVEEASRIRAATHQAMHRGILDAILVLTDGREVDPGGGVPAPDPSVPLFAVGVGKEAGSCDLGLENVAHEEVLPPGTPLVVRFDLVKQGGEACRTQVLLKQEDRILARKSVPLGAGERRKRESLACTPIEAGDLEWVLEAEPLPGEAGVENNCRPVRAHVLKTRTRVLLVEGRPRWEFRHLKNALVRDPTLDVHVLLTTADPGYLQEGSREAPSLHQFPFEAALAGYDVILVGDVDPRCPPIRATHRSPETLFAALERHVTRSGGGLALMSGPQHLDAWLSAPGLKNVLPVVRTHPVRPWYGETPFHFRLTRAGRQSPLLALLPDPAANTDLLEGRPFRPAHGPLAAPLPPFLGCARNVEAKPGAEVLATGGEAATPLLVTTQVGAGRVLFSGIEETWLWRREHEDRYYYRFWRQVLHYLARPPWRTPGPVRILTAQEATAAGGRVWVEVLPGGGVDPVVEPAPGLPDHLLVETPGGSVSSLALAPDPETPPCRTGSFEARCPGEYRIRLVAGGPVRARVRVDPAVRELDRTDPDLAWLGHWVGRERYAPLEAADGLLKILPGAPQKGVLNRGLEPAWNRLWALLLFLSLLTGEWICRLRMRLL